MCGYILWTAGFLLLKALDSRLSSSQSFEQQVFIFSGLWAAGLHLFRPSDSILSFLTLFQHNRWTYHNFCRFAKSNQNEREMRCLQHRYSLLLNSSLVEPLWRSEQNVGALIIEVTIYFQFRMFKNPRTTNLTATIFKAMMPMFNLNSPNVRRRIKNLFTYFSLF